MVLYLILGIIMLLSMFVQSKLNSKIAHYSKIYLRNGMSGKEIAEKMLRDNGIYDVQVVSIKGKLTDHYNPTDKTVNLSEIVYNERNAAAAAVAAHECGHAVQHAVGYSMLRLRSQLVPIVSISSNLVQFVIMAGVVMLGMQMLLGKAVLLVGVLLFSVTTLFAFVTLPVEYDASNRALTWLKKENIVNQEELEGAKDSLKWAASTYLVAALGSLAQLLYYISMLLGNNRR